MKTERTKAQQDAIDARVAKQKATLARKSAERRAEIIRQELAQPRAAHCRCGITPAITEEELRALGSGCTPGWVCTTLDAIRRRLD